MKLSLKIAAVLMMIMMSSLTANALINSELKGNWLINYGYQTTNDVSLEFIPTTSKSGSLKIHIYGYEDDFMGTEIDYEVIMTATYSIVGSKEVKVNISSAQTPKIILHTFTIERVKASESDQTRLRTEIMSDARAGLKALTKQFNRLWIEVWPETEYMEISDGVSFYTAQLLEQ